MTSQREGGGPKCYDRTLRVRVDETAFDTPKTISGIAARRDEGPPTVPANQSASGFAERRTQETFFWQRTQDLSGFRGCFFVGVVGVAPIGITFDTAHDSFIGLVEDRAQKSLRQNRRGVDRLENFLGGRTAPLND
jgi:hypothetical protein